MSMITTSLPLQCFEAETIDLTNFSDRVSLAHAEILPGGDRHDLRSTHPRRPHLEAGVGPGPVDRSVLPLEPGHLLRMIRVELQPGRFVVTGEHASVIEHPEVFLALPLPIAAVFE